jgi:hypothetical protein
VVKSSAPVCGKGDLKWWSFRVIAGVLSASAGPAAPDSTNAKAEHIMMRSIRIQGHERPSHCESSVAVAVLMRKGSDRRSERADDLSTERVPTVRVAHPVRNCGAAQSSGGRTLCHGAAWLSTGTML